MSDKLDYNKNFELVSKSNKTVKIEISGSATPKEKKDLN